jgi:glycosyltransferase involved in cell wall biosynthesis
VQFHILSFEGPDPYSRAGGLASRVEGLAETLTQLGFETHLWFVGDPDLPGHEVRGALHLHRWGQWVSRYHPTDVYDGEFGKHDEFARTAPPHIVREWMLPHLATGARAVVLAEEWHTADAVLHLGWLLERAGLRERVTILWNANNTFGFERIDWRRLAKLARITTVSRYMKQRMWPLGVDPIVVPNGLPGDAFSPPDRAGCAELRSRLRDRTVVVKMARWDPDKRWLAAVQSVALMKRVGWRPLLVARGGSEAHGEEVLRAMRAQGLARVDREWRQPGLRGLMEAIHDVKGADVVNLRSHVDSDARRVLFRGAHAVLANSVHEPFGLVGLEAMAAGGLACTGPTGEDYAVPGQNALVLETGDPRELLGMLQRLRGRPDEARSIRRAARSTARRFAWPDVVQRVLLPRLEILMGDEEDRRLAPRVQADPKLAAAS